MSDGIQFDSPRVIYSKLSKFEEIHCDIIDIDKQQILEEDYFVFQNEDEFWDFDAKVWSYDTSKYNTRIVLYTKK